MSINSWREFLSIFSLFLFSFALEKYFDKKVTTVVNNSYELAKNYVDEVRNKIQSEIVLIAFDANKSKKFLNDKDKEYLEPDRIETIVKKYSDHIAQPVSLKSTKKGEHVHVHNVKTKKW